MIAPWTRNERGPTAGLKTISYADNIIALRHAHRCGADEAIFANRAVSCARERGRTSSWPTKGELVTPTLASGCLAGVTRELLLEWFPEIVEADVSISALAEADEAFLTSTSRDVHPIRHVDGVELSAAPGPLTRRAMQAWADNLPFLSA